MISNLLKQYKNEIYSLAQKTSQGKSLLKQMDNLWNRLEKLSQKEFK